MSLNILVIRRDNIGDLVCTLPMIAALRAHYPDAWIGALVTRYNAEVLHANPDIDEVFSYQKAKHLGPGESLVKNTLARVRQLWSLRQRKLDLILLPASGTQRSAQQMATLIGAARVLSQDDVPASNEARHEVERTANILRALGVATNPLPAAHVVPRPELREALRDRLAPRDGGPLLGVHISSRKPSQRWQAERFVELMRALHARRPGVRFALFWSPGAENNPLHPGDDDKARAIFDACTDVPLAPCPTHSLAELIAGLSLTDALLCSDGGHMHLAASLAKPIVAMFGQSDVARWHPWDVPYRVIQPASHAATDISVTEVVDALASLDARLA